MSKLPKTDKSGFEDDGFRFNDPEFHSAQKRDLRSIETGLDCSAETHLKEHPEQDVHQAQQNLADEHNIVNLVEKLINFGIGVETPVPISGDFTNYEDYHTTMNKIAKAQSEFNELPAHIRQRFDNDAGKFLDFFFDDNNREEAEKLGFIKPTTIAPEGKTSSDAVKPADEGSGGV